LIEYYVDQKTRVARKRVQDAETVIMQQLEQMRNVEKVQWTTTTSATTLVLVRNTQVFQTTLPALTVPRTLWQKITWFPSPS
jgi:cell division protein FtsL